MRTCLAVPVVTTISLLCTEAVAQELPWGPSDSQLAQAFRVAAEAQRAREQQLQAAFQAAAEAQRAREQQQEYALQAAFEMAERESEQRIQQMQAAELQRQAEFVERYLQNNEDSASSGSRLADWAIHSAEKGLAKKAVGAVLGQSAGILASGAVGVFVPDTTSIPTTQQESLGLEAAKEFQQQQPPPLTRSQLKELVLSFEAARAYNRMEQEQSVQSPRAHTPSAPQSSSHWSMDDELGIHGLPGSSSHSAPSTPSRSSSNSTTSGKVELPSSWTYDSSTRTLDFHK